MVLLEHDAKGLLAAAGMAVPPGVLATADGHGALPGPGPWMVKAQVPTGGRGKAGGVRAAADAAGVNEAMRAILGMAIKGLPVRACRIEQQAAGHEAYVSLSVDAAGAGIRLLLSLHGGIEVEAAGETVRGALAAPDAASVAAAFTALLAEFGVQTPRTTAIAAAVPALIEAFFANEATLLEINPLILPDASGCIAGDAKMILDGNAIARLPAIEALVRARADAYPDVFLKLDSGFDFVELDAGGSIGMVTTGAGLSMMLTDELTARGLRPFNFCDIRTGQMRGDPRRLIDVLGWIARGPNIRVVLVSVFAGITDLGEFARLLVQAMRASPTLRVPVVARIIGNNFDAARRTIADAGLAIVVEPDLDRAIAEVARLAAAPG